MNTLIYIHGFNSSHLSEKATFLKAYLRQNEPELNLVSYTYRPYPEEAVSGFRQAMEQVPEGKLFLMGSSLGGFLTTFLVEKYRPDARAVLINPAVKPFEHFQMYKGEVLNDYTNETYKLTDDHYGQLCELDTPEIANPENYLVCVEEGDEVLNFREAADKYKKSHLKIFKGGSHRFENFEGFLPSMMTFLKNNT